MTRTNARRLVAATVLVTNGCTGSERGSVTAPSSRGAEGRLILEGGADAAARTTTAVAGTVPSLADDLARRTLVFGDGELGVVERISPATFDGGATVASMATPGTEPYACDAFGWDWIDDWKDAFLGLTKYREATYLHQRQGAFTFYPGAAVYHGTNTNSKTYLGACNGDSADDLTVTIQRRISGQWVTIATVAVGGYEKFTFYSGLWASYRGKAQGADGSVVEHYGVGAAWTPSPGLVSAH